MNSPLFKRMVKTMSFWLITALVVGLGWLILGVLKADAAVSQLDGSAYPTGLSGTNFAQKLGAGVGGSISSATVRCPFGVHATLYLLEYNTSDFSSYSQGWNQTGWTSCADGSIGVDTVLSLPSPVTLNSTKFYTILTAFNATAGMYGSTNSAAYPNGEACQNNADGTCGYAITGIYAAYFILPDATPAAAAPSTISLIFPTSTTSQDFLYWHLSYSDNTATSGQTSVGVRVAPTTSTLDLATADNGRLDLSLDVASSSDIHIQKGVPRFNTWYAQALLFHSTTTDVFGQPVLHNSDIIASTTPFSFTIIQTIAGGINTPTSTATSSAFTITCDPASEVFGVSLCNLGVALFIPSSDSLQVFPDLAATLSTKPPFGYIGSFTTALEGIDTATTSAYTLPDVSNVPFYQTLNTRIAYLLYLLFAAWVIHRIGKQQL